MGTGQLKRVELRATARINGKSHATIIGWEEHLAEMEDKWSPISLGKKITPAMAIGYVERPRAMEEMLNWRSWQANSF